MAEKKKTAAKKKKPIKKKLVPRKSPEVTEPTSLVPADVGKRIAAALLEGVLVYVISFLPYIGALIGAAYLAVRDALPLGSIGGQSLGKKLFGLQAVRIPDGAPCDYVTSVLRNLPFIVPALLMIKPGIGWVLGSVVWLVVFTVEVLLVIADEKGLRIGDRIAKTSVVEVTG